LDRYKPIKTIHRYTRENEFKPDKHLLLEIIKEIGAKPENTVYVGDSLMKDIHMAQQAKVTDIFARYGVSQDNVAYDLLRRVSHWTLNDVEKEKQIYKFGLIKPNYILNNSFSEILTLFKFVPHKRGD
jgi:phosphoglycolate phosphatase